MLQEIQFRKMIPVIYIYVSKVKTNYLFFDNKLLRIIILRFSFD